MHGFGGDGVVEPDFCRMEQQTFTFGAVEFVTNDRAAQSVGMGAMDAQLMGAPRLRIECHQVVGYHFVVSDGTFAVFQVHNLSWTVHRVRSQWQGDGAGRRSKV